MTTYCQKGRELLMDLQRSDWLPAYDEHGITQVIGEMNTIQEQQNKHLDGRQESTLPKEDKPYRQYLRGCFDRNLRYSHAYFVHRMDKIRSLRWEAGPVIPDQMQKEILSAAEQGYFNDYSSLLAKYHKELGVDLASDLEPPKDLFIEIRVLVPCGEIYTENGPVSLDKGSTHFLRRSDVEHLIRQGRVEMFRS